jgi:ribosome maturation factor RimP
LFLSVVNTGIARSPLVGRVQALLERVVERMGYELVGVEYVHQHGRSILRIYIDKAEGVTVHDCQMVSEQVGALLDVEDPLRRAYYLEVSSPGIERPLFTREQFARFIGRRARVRTSLAIEGRRNFVGVIARVDSEVVLLLPDGHLVALAVPQIEKARLVPEE